MKKTIQGATLLIPFSALFFLFSSYSPHSAAFQRWTVEARDILFKVRSASDGAPELAKSIVIVSIDDESCEKLGERWPWSRRTFAAMIHEFSKRGVKVVALNLSFSGLEDETGASTALLAQEMKENGHVLVGATFDKSNRLLKPTPQISEAASYGYLEKIVDDDYLIRRSYLLRPYSFQGAGDEGVSSENYFEASFPLKLASLVLGSQPAFNSQEALLTIGDPKAALPLGSDGSYSINYLARESDLTEIPAWKIVKGRLDGADLRGKIVLVGLTSSLFSEKNATPLGMTPLGLIPGVLIHANELLAILSHRPLRFIPNSVTFGVSWLVAVCLLALFLWRRWWLALIGFGVSFLALFIVSESFFSKDLVLEPFYVLSGPVLALFVGFAENTWTLFMEKKGLETKAIHDKMTGLYTYDHLRTRLEDEWKRCEKLALPVSIAMTDLDRFKKINDTLGHETGNQMILRAAAVIRESARGYDVVARYGGDEFVILLWHSNLDEAKAYRQRLRILYETMAKKLDEPALHDSSISIGVASFDPKINPALPAGPQQLIEEADRDLFLDKESRRKPGQSSR